MKPNQPLQVGLVALVLAGASTSSAPAQSSIRPLERSPAQDSPRAKSAKDAGALVFREHRVTDPGMKDAVISTLLVPEGWKVEGGATRTGNNLWYIPIVLDVAVKSPDGRGAHFGPSLAFEFNFADPGQLMRPTRGGKLYYPLPQSPGQWFMEMAELSPVPGLTELRLVVEEDIPEITKQLRAGKAARFQSVAQLNETTASFGIATHFDTQATKLVTSFKLNGKRIEQTTVMTWQYEVVNNQGRITDGFWNIFFMNSISGPVGTNYLEDPALNAVFQSVRNNPAWMAEMAKYWNELARIQHKGNMDRIQTIGEISRTHYENANDVSDIMMRGWRSRDAASDRLQEKQVDGIWEQSAYQTPAGETIKLPSFYDHVYTDGGGRYILHNDAFYEPNRDPTFNGVSWERIEAKAD